jgi:hypothetical protein
MAREPQRRERAAPLGAAIVPVQRALLARAKALDDRVAAFGDDDPSYAGTLEARALTAVAEEFRALAGELEYWLWPARWHTRAVATRTRRQSMT